MNAFKLAGERELFLNFDGPKKVKIILKRFVSVGAAALALVAAAMWSVARGAVLQPLPAVQPGSETAQAGGHAVHENVKPVPVQHAQKDASSDKHVSSAAIQPKSKKPPMPAPQTGLAIKMIPIDRLLKESAGSSDAVKPGIALGKMEKAAAADEVGFDIGKGLPLPVPESVLISPVDKPDGFHVGVDYHVDPKWDLTGLAGVTTTGGVVASPAKPSVNQVGVRASYRF